MGKVVWRGWVSNPEEIRKANEMVVGPFLGAKHLPTEQVVLSPNTIEPWFQVSV
jgi:hypothetical protein